MHVVLLSHRWPAASSSEMPWTQNASVYYKTNTRCSTSATLNVLRLRCLQFFMAIVIVIVDVCTFVC